MSRQTAPALASVITSARQPRRVVGEPKGLASAQRPNEVPAAVSARPGGSRLGGLQLGGYQLTQRLHRGRMSHVMLAKARGIGGIDRKAVVKVLRSRFAQDMRFVNSFLHEERVTGSLNHPHLVQLLDSGSSEYGYYMVLEHIQGWSLQQIFDAAARERQPVPLNVALSIAHGIASGLHHLHDFLRNQERRVRMVHRDIQPANVMVTDSGFAKLIDFGSVTIEGMDREQPPVPMALNSYMAPETATGARIDRRGDIYSLGALLYRMTTGCEPERRGGSTEVIAPSAIASNYVRDLEELILHTLHSDPDRRLQSAASLQLAFEDIAAKYRFSLSQRQVSTFLEKLMGERMPATEQAPPVARAPITQARPPVPAGVAPRRAAPPPVPAGAAPRRPVPPPVPLMPAGPRPRVESPARDADPGKTRIRIRAY